MEYKELSKLYHMNASSTRDNDIIQEEATRRGAVSTFPTGFHTANGELFVAVPRELSILSERIMRTEQQVSALLDDIPALASRAALRGLVLDEVVCTNAIEDIHSTKRQVKDAIEASRSGNWETRRFKELGMLYLDIVEGRAQIPATPEDIRAIYDRVMGGELDSGKIPDGQLFRAHGVDVTDGGVRILHSGLEPESRIIEAMEVMLALVSSGEVPGLYAATASHSLFEYTHPFYDGNGRCGRYLLSLFLSDILSKATALSLSRTIAENRNDYYRAFRTVENPMNKGELTFFVYAMLELVHKAQNGIIGRLEDGMRASANIDDAMGKIVGEFDLKPQERQAVSLLAQYEAFGLMGDEPVHEIAQHLEVGDQMARKHLASLERKGIVEKRRLRKPLTFALTPQIKEKHGLGRANELPM